MNLSECGDFVNKVGLPVAVVIFCMVASWFAGKGIWKNVILPATAKHMELMSVIQVTQVSMASSNDLLSKSIAAISTGFSDMVRQQDQLTKALTTEKLETVFRHVLNGEKQLEVIRREVDKIHKEINPGDEAGDKK